MKPLPLRATIGILGGGQLGRMTALAAARMGYKTHIYAQNADEPACQVTPYRTLGAFNDTKKLAAFAKQVDVVTLEWENVPVAALLFLQKHVATHPSASVLKITQDRIEEKRLARSLKLGVPNFYPVKNAKDAERAFKALGGSCIFKTAHGGYDGKGQVLVRDAKKVKSAFAGLKSSHVIAEQLVKFQKEISVIVARSENGAMKTYPVVENRHKDSILDETRAPAKISKDVEKQALNMARTLAQKLNIVGLLAVEMFVADGKVLMNEMAPRPHNSGHWTMDFCVTSQFEQFVRAICGLKLGDTSVTSSCLMKNLIGGDVKKIDAYMKQKDTHLHLYGKKEARPRRKMGHVNIGKGRR